MYRLDRYDTSAPLDPNKWSQQQRCFRIRRLWAACRNVAGAWCPHLCRLRCSASSPITLWWWGIWLWGCQVLRHSWLCLASPRVERHKKQNHSAWFETMYAYARLLYMIYIIRWTLFEITKPYQTCIHAWSL